MGRRTTTTTTTIIALGLLVASPLMARRLTTTQMRENTIRINALEIEEPGDNTVPAKKITCEDIMGPIQPIVFDEGALNFDFDKSIVKAQYFDLLKNIKEFVEQNNYEITIVGHTDSIGSNQYNFGLSRRRAEAVKAKLLEFGLAEDRIVGIEAMGEEQPIATNATKEGRAQNRRVEFKLVQRETVQEKTAAPVANENK